MTIAATISPGLTAEESFLPLKEYVIAVTGLSYYRERNAELTDHFLRRFAALGIDDCRTYLQVLNDGLDGERELDCLIEELTIGETHFFRHPELFQALQQTILPEVIERNQCRRRLRIWSAGSSIGAEAYTVSILLRSCFAERIRDWDVSILGTDINRSYLSQAVRAQFENWALRGTSDEVKERCFTRCGAYWELRPEYKQDVSFLYHNLAKHACPSLLHNLAAFDVVLCRNVMIYFSPTVIERIVENLRRCLADGGWLLVGHAEHNPKTFRDYRTISFDGVIAYRRIDRSEPAERPSHEAGYRTPQLSVPSRPPCEDERPARRISHSRPMPTSLSPTESRSVCEPRVEPAEIRTLADQGDLEAAAVQCRRLIQARKLDPTGHFYQALILGQLGDQAQCESALRRAIYLNRNFAPAYYYLGITLLRAMRRDEAVRALRYALRLTALDEPARVLDEFDGLTVAQLEELTRLQLETLES